MTHFRPIDNFDGTSYSPTCPVTGDVKQGPGLGKQAHEVDEFIFRGPEITFQDGRGEASLGHFDVRPDAIRQAAIEYLQMIPREIHDEVCETVLAYKSELEVAVGEIRSLREQVGALTIGNAEQIVQLEAMETLLEEMYEVPEPGDDMLDQESLLSLEELAALEEQVEG